MRKTKSNLVIKEQNPWRIFFVVVLIVVSIVVLTVLAFESGYRKNDDEFTATLRNLKDYKAREDFYKTTVRKLQRENRNLKSAVAKLKSFNVIDKHAHERIKQQMTFVQRRNARLEEELKFYKQLTTPRSKPGIVVHSLKIDSNTRAQHTYYFKLTLVQHQDRNRLRTTSGVVKLHISGRRSDGTRGKLNLKDVMAESEGRMEFAMVYLTNLEGRLKLPAGFKPQTVSVFVYPKGRGKRVEKKFDWPINS